MRKTDRERAEELAGPRPQSDAAKKKWLDRVNDIGREIGSVRQDTVAACIDAAEGYFDHGLHAITSRLNALASLYAWCDEED